MTNKLENQLQRILADKTSGSTQILHQLQGTLADFDQIIPVNEKLLANVTEELLATFPDFLILHHFLNALWENFENNEPKPIYQVIRDYQDKWASSGERMAKYFPEEYQGGPFLFHSQSSALTSFGYHLSQRHNHPFVFQTMSRPCNEGELQAKRLKQMGLDVQLVEAISANLIKDQIKAIVVGADLVNERGFKNKTGTYWLGLLAKKHEIPFYVLADSRKMLPPSYPKSIQDLLLNESPDKKEVFNGESPTLTYLDYPFEWTPFAFTTGLITERGIISPSSIQKNRSFTPNSRFLAILNQIRDRKP